MKIGRILLIATGVAATGYAIAYLLRQKNLLANSSADISNVQPKTISFTHIALTADMTVKNTSEINFTIYGGKLKASVNGFPVSDIEISDSSDLPSNGSAVIPIAIDFNPVDSLKSLGKAVALNVNDLKINIKGSVSATSGGIFWNQLPIDVDFNVNEILNRTKNGKQ